MASVIQSIYKTLKTEYEPDIKVRYPFVYDSASIPYIYMYEVDDPRIPDFLCDTSGGQCRMTIGYLSTRFADCVDKIETILTFCDTILGNIGGVEITQINAGNTRDLTDISQAQKKIYRREFDMIIYWSK